jgi:hypothetical protein
MQTDAIIIAETVRSMHMLIQQRSLHGAQPPGWCVEPADMLAPTQHNAAGSLVCNWQCCDGISLHIHLEYFHSAAQAYN